MHNRYFGKKMLKKLINFDAFGDKKKYITFMNFIVANLLIEIY